MNRTKYYVRRALGLSTWHYTREHSIRASTHLPILIGLARLLEIRTVLECGSGLYSTLAFLNRDIFPSLQHLFSYETDPVWKARVEQAAGGDSRLKLVLSREIAPDLSLQDFSRYDLILVDNGTRAEERTAVIARVGSSCSPRSLVVIHDIENDVYRSAAADAGLTCRFISNGLSPFTGVYCKSRRALDAGTKRRLKTWNRDIVSSATTGNADDIQEWIRTAQRRSERTNAAAANVI